MSALFSNNDATCIFINVLEKTNLETTNVIFDKEKAKEAYKRYFKFERERKLKKMPSQLIFGLSAVMVMVGVFFNIDSLWILGVITAAIAAISLFYFFLRFQIASSQYLKKLDKKSTQVDFQFSFDADSILYKSEDVSTELNWTLIKAYVINDKDIYLYLADGELLDIITESILGEDKFARFKALLSEKLDSRK